MGNGYSAAQGRQATMEQTRMISMTFDSLKNPVSLTISRAKFNEALVGLESRGVRRLRETPLSDLLFDAFAVSKHEAMTEMEFLACISPIVGGSVKERMDLTFKVFAGRNISTVPVAVFLNAIEQSWRLACQILIDKRNLRLRGQVDGVTASVAKFSENNAQSIVDAMKLELEILGVEGYIDSIKLAKLFSEDRTIKVTLGTESVEIPTSFVFINKPAAYPELGLRQ